MASLGSVFSQSLTCWKGRTCPCIPVLSPLHDLGDLVLPSMCFLWVRKAHGEHEVPSFHSSPQVLFCWANIPPGFLSCITPVLGGCEALVNMIFIKVLRTLKRWKNFNVVCSVKWSHLEVSEWNQTVTVTGRNNRDYFMCFSKQSRTPGS